MHTHHKLRCKLREFLHASVYSLTVTVIMHAKLLAQTDFNLGLSTNGPTASANQTVKLNDSGRYVTFIQLHAEYAKSKRYESYAGSYELPNSINLGVVMRSAWRDDYVGGSLFFDHGIGRSFSHRIRASRLGLGLDYIGSQRDISINTYWPLSRSKIMTGSVSSTSDVSSHPSRITTLKGIDGKLFIPLYIQNTHFKLAMGVASWEKIGGQALIDLSWIPQHSIIDTLYLKLTVNAQHERYRKPTTFYWHVGSNISWRTPQTKQSIPHADAAYDRRFKPVERVFKIRVYHETSDTSYQNSVTDGGITIEVTGEE
ncbi:MAG: inverse autotransporter beta domain-containing protein [Pseudomonadota bacterium]|nr:inverse autotransporter beta domain-containing protein [Pseudomonadota bacterium]